MHINTIELLVRVGAGVGFGTLIGLERQYRARMAGLRTNALVSLGAALFVLLSAYGFGGGDPTRVAAQIVSGIGFLGGGVILRDGLTVRGLNTAATLWCSAAVGALSGSGLYLAAGVGAVVVTVVNTALRSVGHVVDRVPDPSGSKEDPSTYEFVAVTDDDSEAHVRVSLVQAITRTNFLIQSLASHIIADERVEVRATLTADDRNDRAMETAINQLSMEPSISRVSWNVITDSRTKDL